MKPRGNWKKRKQYIEQWFMSLIKLLQGKTNEFLPAYLYFFRNFPNLFPVHLAFLDIFWSPLIFYSYYMHLWKRLKFHINVRQAFKKQIYIPFIGLPSHPFFRVGYVYCKFIVLDFFKMSLKQIRSVKDEAATEI